jgi:hypothetical protein
MADSASLEKATLFPGETSCSGFTLGGEWPAVVFSSAEECRKATALSREFDVDKPYGYYGSKLIVKRKNK